MGVSCICLVVTLILFAGLDKWIAQIFIDPNSAKARYPNEAFFEPKPFLMFGGSSDSTLQAEYQLNTLGYRGPLPQMPKPENEYRIFVIGGSTVANGDPSISQLLERRFHDAQKQNVKVFNFGVAASITRMDIARLVFQLVELNPDFVIFYGGGNDIILPYQADPRPGYPPNFLAIENNPLFTAGTEKQSWRQLATLALLHSATMRAAIGSVLGESLVPLDAAREKAGWHESEWSHAVAKNYLENLNLAIRLTSGLNIRSHFVFQPLLYFKHTLAENEQRWAFEGLSKHANICREDIREGFKHLKATSNVAISDFSDIFADEAQQVFTDGIHIKQEFYSKLADRIYQAIESGY